MVETKQWTINNHLDKEIINDVATLLKEGEVVAFPTETVYGLGADARNEEAVRKIFQAKGRPQDNPLITHVATKEQLRRLVTEIPPIVEKLIDTFSPGPLTYLLPTNGTCAKNVTAGLSTIGVRMPSHPVAQALLKACDIPISAPSANTSGRPSPTMASHVKEDLNGKIAGILDGGVTGVGVESTVIDCSHDIPLILRPGGITREQLEEVVGEVMVDPALLGDDAQPKAPGMKYTHYAPEVPMWLIEGSAADLNHIIDQEKGRYPRIGVMACNETAKQLHAEPIITLGSKQSLNEIATHLYDALRTFKEGDVDLILCEAFPETGIGHAIMNRLKKAATAYINPNTKK